MFFLIYFTYLPVFLLLPLLLTSPTSHLTTSPHSLLVFIKKGAGLPWALTKRGTLS